MLSWAGFIDRETEHNSRWYTSCCKKYLSDVVVKVGVNVSETMGYNFVLFDPMY